MDEIHERNVAKGVLGDYLTTLDAVSIYSARGMSIKTSPVIINRLDVLKENLCKRKLVARYYNYNISDEEIRGIREEKVSHDKLTEILTKVATLLNKVN